MSKKSDVYFVCDLTDNKNGISQTSVPKKKREKMAIFQNDLWLISPREKNKPPPRTPVKGTRYFCVSSPLKYFQATSAVEISAWHFL